MAFTNATHVRQLRLATWLATVEFHHSSFQGCGGGIAVTAGIVLTKGGCNSALGRQLARNLGKDEDEVVRHLRQRVGVLIFRDNAMMMASRHPTFAPPDIDGVED